MLLSYEPIGRNGKVMVLDSSVLWLRSDTEMVGWAPPASSPTEGNVVLVVSEEGTREALVVKFVSERLK